MHRRWFLTLLTDHGEQLAEQCYKWLVDGGLLEQGLRPSP